MVILKLGSGALCHIDCSRRADYGYDERIEVFGSNGLAISDRKPRGEVRLYQGGKSISDSLHPGWFERMEPTFYRALDAFIKAVQGEKTEYPTLRDGLMAQMIAEAAVDSLKTNQPVKITYWSPEKMRN
jgi:myo-inositol 2-dehydrogenase/D-chiro-inositol 1-dehydrogenase